MKKTTNKTFHTADGGINTLVLLRILIGLFFLIVGGQKLTGAHQNFLYVVQGYELFPDRFSFLESWAAFIVPWIELFGGVFLLLGLWLKRTLQVFLILAVSFIIVVGQAMIRGLPLEECGCFGEWFSVPLRGILFFDTILFAALGFLLIRLKQTARLSLDDYFSSQGRGQA